jgi:hypothetical protein
MLSTMIVRSLVALAPLAVGPVQHTNGPAPQAIGPDSHTIGLEPQAIDNGAHPPTADRRAQLSRLSQRLDAGDLRAIDEVLASTQPASPDRTPTSDEIERLRIEVERLRAARPAPTATTTAPVPAAPAVHAPLAVGAIPRDLAMAVREARAWLRADDPNHCLKALPSPTDVGDGAALYQRACALERLGRDAEALDAYRRVAAEATSPLLKLGAASGVDHIAWRLRRAGSPEAKP